MEITNLETSCWETEMVIRSFWKQIDRQPLADSAHDFSTIKGQKHQTLVHDRKDLSQNSKYFKKGLEMCTPVQSKADRVFERHQPYPRQPIFQNSLAA